MILSKQVGSNNQTTEILESIISIHIENFSEALR